MCSLFMAARPAVLRRAHPDIAPQEAPAFCCGMWAGARLREVGCPAPRSHAIVSSSSGPEYYVNVMSFVDKGQLEPGSTVLLHNKVLSVVGLLADEADPMVSVMKVTALAATPPRGDLHASPPPHLTQSHLASPPCEDAQTASGNALPPHPLARRSSFVAVPALRSKPFGVLSL